MTKIEALELKLEIDSKVTLLKAIIEVELRTLKQIIDHRTEKE